MANKKSRVPTPPRKVEVAKPRQAQAARARSSRGEKGPGGPRRTRLLVVALGSVVAVVAVVVAVLAFTGGGEDASASSALAAAGCTDEVLPDQGRNDVTALEAGFTYNSYPATSGPHNPQWALWGYYERPVPFISSTHNLEHGGIVVRYGEDVPQETVDEIRAWYNSDPQGLLVAPLTGDALSDKVALTAWTHLAVCPGFDQNAFSSFRDAYRFKGPERIPIEGMQPGT